MAAHVQAPSISQQPATGSVVTSTPGGAPTAEQGTEAAAPQKSNNKKPSAKKRGQKSGSEGLRQMPQNEESSTTSSPQGGRHNRKNARPLKAKSEESSRNSSAMNTRPVSQSVLSSTAPSDQVVPTSSGSVPLQGPPESVDKVQEKRNVLPMAEPDPMQALAPSATVDTEVGIYPAASQTAEVSQKQKARLVPKPQGEDGPSGIAAPSTGSPKPKTRRRTPVSTAILASAAATSEAEDKLASQTPFNEQRRRSTVVKLPSAPQQVSSAEALSRQGEVVPPQGVSDSAPAKLSEPHAVQQTDPIIRQSGASKNAPSLSIHHKGDVESQQQSHHIEKPSPSNDQSRMLEPSDPTGSQQHEPKIIESSQTRAMHHSKGNQSTSSISTVIASPYLPSQKMQKNPEPAIKSDLPQTPQNTAEHANNASYMGNSKTTKAPDHNEGLQTSQASTRTTQTAGGVDFPSLAEAAVIAKASRRSSPPSSLHHAKKPSYSAITRREPPQPAIIVDRKVIGYKNVTKLIKGPFKKNVKSKGKEKVLNDDRPREEVSKKEDPGSQQRMEEETLRNSSEVNLGKEVASEKRTSKSEADESELQQEARWSDLVDVEKPLGKESSKWEELPKRVKPSGRENPGEEQVKKILSASSFKWNTSRAQTPSAPHANPFEKLTENLKTAEAGGSRSQSMDSALGSEEKAEEEVEPAHNNQSSANEKGKKIDLTQSVTQDSSAQEDAKASLQDKRGQPSLEIIIQATTNLPTEGKARNPLSGDPYEETVVSTAHLSSQTSTTVAKDISAGSSGPPAITPPVTTHKKSTKKKKKKKKPHPALTSETSMTKTGGDGAQSPQKKTSTGPVAEESGHSRVSSTYSFRPGDEGLQHVVTKVAGPPATDKDKISHAVRNAAKELLAGRMWLISENVENNVVEALTDKVHEVMNDQQHQSSVKGIGKSTQVAAYLDYASSSTAGSDEDVHEPQAPSKKPRKRKKKARGKLRRGTTDTPETPAQQAADPTDEKSASPVSPEILEKTANEIAAGLTTTTSKIEDDHDGSQKIILLNPSADGLETIIRDARSRSPDPEAHEPRTPKKTSDAVAFMPTPSTRKFLEACASGPSTKQFLEESEENETQPRCTLKVMKADELLQAEKARKERTDAMKELGEAQKEKQRHQRKAKHAKQMSLRRKTGAPLASSPPRRQRTPENGSSDSSSGSSEDVSNVSKRRDMQRLKRRGL